MEGTRRQSNKRRFSVSLPLSFFYIIDHSYYRINLQYSPRTLPFCIVLERAATDMDIGSLLQKNDEFLINRKRSSRQTFRIYIYFSLHLCILA